MDRRTLLSALPFLPFVVPAAADKQVVLFQYPLLAMTSVPQSQISGWLANGWRLKGPEVWSEYIDDPAGGPDPILIGQQIRWPGEDHVFRWRSKHHPLSGGFEGWLA